jgi:hypothetical protein
MNDAKAIELAFMDALKTGELSGATVRAWQSLAESQVGNKSHAREFPCIDVRASPPETAADGIHRSCTVSVSCVSHVEDDLDHSAVSAIYEAAQAIIDALYYQYRKATDGAEKTAFAARLTADAPLVTCHGLQVGAGSGPNDIEGLNVIAISLVVHFTKSGF